MAVVFETRRPTLPTRRPGASLVPARKDLDPHPIDEQGPVEALPLTPEATDMGNRRRGLWNAQREELRDTLASEDALCSQLYREVVDALGGPALDHGALVVAGHAIRELVNRLPSVLGDADLEERVEDQVPRDALVRAWTTFQAEIASGASAEGHLPPKLASAIEAWVTVQRQITENSRTRRAALVLGTVEGAEDSSVRVVNSAIGAFERIRHPSKSSTDAPVDQRAYQGALTIIENAITSRVLGFFAVKQHLRDSVDAANLRSPDGRWTAPSIDDVQTTVARIGGLQHRRVFYDQLANPQWIEPLHRLGALNAPGATDPAAQQRWQPWPAGDYLVRMAQHRPAEVRVILLQLVNESAPSTAKISLLEAALRMPATESRYMAKAIRAHLTSELEPQVALDVVTLIETLAQATESEAAMSLAQAVLRPRAGPETGVRGYRNVRAGIDSYWYAEALRRVVSALRADRRLLGTVYAWLREEQQISGSWDPSRDWDTSGVWRPSISEHEQNYRHHDIADALIDALRDLAIEEIESGLDVEHVMRVLERDRIPVAMRIAIFALSEVSGSREDTKKASASRVLDRELLHHPWFFREYTQLAATTLQHLDDEAFARWEALVHEGPPLTKERRQRLVEHRAADQSEQDAYDQYAEMRRHELLSAVGAGALRGDLLQLHTALVKDLGEYEHAGFRSWHTTMIGEEIPAVANDLQAMSVENALTLLREWEPGGGQPGTKSGLAEALRGVTESRPREFSKHTQSFLDLNEPYASRFLDALRKVSESDAADIDWLSYLRGVRDLERNVQTDERRATYPVQQVCNTIENAVGGQATTLPLPLFNDAVALVSQWVAHPDPSEAGIEGSDHLTAAFNSTRPIAVRTLIRIARAAKLAQSPEIDAEDVISTVEAALAGRLEPRDSSLAVAAAFGEGLSLMMWIDAQWTESWLAQATTSDSWGDVFVTTAVATNPTSTDLLAALWSSIDGVLSRLSTGESVEVGWASNRSLEEAVGDHLMTLAMWGATSPWPERTQSYFGRVDPETAASVLGQVGSRLMNTDEPPRAVIERAELMWDARQAAVDRGEEDAHELTEFYWWVHSNKFAVDWWLPRLARVADQIPFDGRSFIGQHLEAAARTHPGETVAVMSHLLGTGEMQSLGRYGLLRSAPNVIARGLRCGDETVNHQSQALMDLLGAQGIVDMDTKVDAALHDLDASGDAD